MIPHRGCRSLRLPVPHMVRFPARLILRDIKQLSQGGIRHGGMSLLREVIPGRTYMVTRRCSERRFFLRPDPYFCRFMYSPHRRRRRRVRSRPSTARVSKSGGVALRAVAPMRTTMNSSLGSQAIFSA